MKQMKRTGVYKAANVTFCPRTMKAESYNWWRFVKIIQGKVVFNNYKYSVTTAKHQRKVANLLEELGLKVDYFVSVRESLEKFDEINILTIECAKEEQRQAELKEQKRVLRNAKAKARRHERKGN